MFNYGGKKDIHSVSESIVILQVSGFVLKIFPRLLITITKLELRRLTVVKLTADSFSVSWLIVAALKWNVPNMCEHYLNKNKQVI